MIAKAAKPLEVFARIEPDNEEKMVAMGHERDLGKTRELWSVTVPMHKVIQWEPGRKKKLGNYSVLDREKPSRQPTGRVVMA